MYFRYLHPATLSPIVNVLVSVTYRNKHNIQGQGISHHHLHHNKTHKYHRGHSASSVPSPKSRPPPPTHTHTHTQTHTHTHTHKEATISIAFTHPHIQAAIPHTHQQPHMQTLTTPHPDALASHSWLSEATVWVKPRVSYTWLWLLFILWVLRGERCMVGGRGS